MTSSLEEHVARAIAPDGPRYWDNGLSEEYKAQWLACASAAIAAVRQHDAMKCGWPDCDCGGPNNVPQRCKEAASIRESERAACEAIARGEKVDSDATNDECDEAYNMACDHIAYAIAERKGKGDMSEEESVRLMVSRLEGEMAHGYHTTDICRDMNALIADWRKRGEALDRMTEYAAELETAIGAVLTQPRSGNPEPTSAAS